MKVCAIAIMLLGLGAGSAAAQLPLEPPTVPSGLTVPAGNTLFLVGYAIGTQNYMCLPTAKKTMAWRPVGPQATLFDVFDGAVSEQLTTHFLSVNPAEGTTTRPTWQHSDDSSRVWGRVVASSSDATFVAPGAIPWLLLERVGAQLGPTGGGILAQTTFIQRVNTSAGAAPSTGCSNDDHVGAFVLVPYTTEYYFYRASGVN